MALTEQTAVDGLHISIANGVVQSAHVSQVYQVLKNGKVVSEARIPPMPVANAGALSLPGILDVALSTALAGNEDLQKQVSALTATSTDLGSQVSDRETRITNLTDKIAKRDLKITDLEATVVDRELKIDDLQLTISNKNARITELESSIMVKGARIDDLKSNLSGKDLRITDLEAVVADKDSRIDKKDSRIADLEMRLSVYEPPEPKVPVNSVLQALGKLELANAWAKALDLTVQTLVEAKAQRPKRVIRWWYDSNPQLTFAEGEWLAIVAEMDKNDMWGNSSQVELIELARNPPPDEEAAGALLAEEQPLKT